MATYQTPNIGLNKWAETDYFKRVEINENFDKIDVELQAQKDQLDSNSNQIGILNEQLADTASKLQGAVKTQYLKTVRYNMQDSIFSVLDSKKAYDDTLATVFTENWADLSKWVTPGTPGVQVSGNKLYSTGTGGANSGANHSYALAANEKLRAIFKVSIPSYGTSGGVIVGVSSANAGSAPAGGGGDAFGIYIKAGPNNKIQYVDMGNFGDCIESVNNDLGDYIVTVTVDETYISVVAVKTDGSIEASARRLRAGFNVNNLYVFNSDSRALSGMYVEFVSARKGLQTLPFGEGIAKTVQWTGDGTQSWKIYLPKNYDSRIPSPVAIVWHGNGTDETQWSINTNMKTMQKALVEAGYIVLACSLNASKTTWGNQASTNAYYQAYKYLKSNYAIGSVVFYANSMGGIESLNALAENKIPCCAWAATVPTYDLRNNYDNPMFTGAIRGAYGIAPDGSDYATKTAGRDPALMSPYAFRCVPMMALAPADDAAVSKAENTDKLIDAVKNTAIEVQRIDVPNGTGGHSFLVEPYKQQIIDFFNKYI
jgi:hypothetical protein